MVGSLLAVLAAYQNNLVTSKTMTSQVVQCLLLQMSRKVDFRSESVNPGTKLLMNASGKELVG